MQTNGCKYSKEYTNLCSPSKFTMLQSNPFDIIDQTLTLFTRLQLAMCIENKLIDVSIQYITTLPG